MIQKLRHRLFKMRLAMVVRAHNLILWPADRWLYFWTGWTLDTWAGEE